MVGFPLESSTCIAFKSETLVSVLMIVARTEPCLGYNVEAAV